MLFYQRYSLIHLSMSGRVMVMVKLMLMKIYLFG
jgi:hypothetical protein